MLSFPAEGELDVSFEADDPDDPDKPDEPDEPDELDELDEPDELDEESRPLPESGPGELVLCWPAVTRQARTHQARDLLDEACVLAVHGLAHLLGHDHLGAAEGRRMHTAERRALAAIRVADIRRPYGRRPVRS